MGDQHNRPPVSRAREGLAFIASRPVARPPRGGRSGTSRMLFLVAIPVAGAPAADAATAVGSTAGGAA